MNVEEAIDAYRQLRDKKAEIQKQHKEQLSPYNEMLEKLNGFLLNAMHQQGVKSFATDKGTAFQTTRDSYTVSDWNAFLKFVRERNAFHLLEHRANKTAVEETLTETNELPDGLKLSREIRVSVRK